MEITLADNLKELRLKKGLTQERLASYLGVSFQAISKWEHGETYPDICMLPAIASFFNVTTDYLLCVDKSKKDEAINTYISQYEKLWSQSRFEEVMKVMQKAVSEFPGEFSLLVRYLNALIWNNSCNEKSAVGIRSEVEEIYAMIRDGCKVDSIRIWAKKLVCQYYFRLSSIENSGIVYSDAAALLSELPLMQNSRDYLSCILCSDAEEKNVAAKNLISEAVFILCKAVNAMCEDSGKAPSELLEIQLLTANILETVYRSGDFGKNYINAAVIYARIACIYREIGNKDEADKFAHKACITADSFDKSSEILTHNSPLLKGHTVQKSKIPMVHGDSLSARVERILNNR